MSEEVPYTSVLSQRGARTASYRRIFLYSAAQGQNSNFHPEQNPRYADLLLLSVAIVSVQATAEILLLSPECRIKEKVFKRKSESP